MNPNIYQVLMSLDSSNQMQQQPNMQPFQRMQQQNPAGYMMALRNMGVSDPFQKQPQYQQPSWLDVLNQTLMSGNMMPQQQPFNPYAFNMTGMNGNQAQPNWWQKGLQGTGATLSGLSSPLTSAGFAGLSAGLPYAPYAAGAGVAAGGLGSLFQYLGQPGQMQ
jgi:hypothetical protein